MITAIVNLVGFLVAAIGSCIAMWGVFKQANGYFSFKPEVLVFAETVLRICKTLVSNGREQAYRHTLETFNDANEREEDRVQSLIGFYAVFAGFLFQLMGSAILYISTLIALSKPANCAN